MQYAERFGEPRSPPMEERLMIDAEEHLRLAPSFMILMACFVPRKTPSRLTVVARRHCPSVIDSIDARR
jgi:hypothetical protein